MPHSTPKWKISHFTSYYKSIVVCITTRIDNSPIFWKKFKMKAKMAKWFEWDWLIFSLLTKKYEGFINVDWSLFVKYVLKMHGPKSKFIMIVVQL